MKKTVRGFTLVELLVVIAIIAILAAVVVLIVNPLELTRRSRDAARLSDFANLQQAINVYMQEATAAAPLACTGGAVDTVCRGDSETGTRATNGTGWVHMDLSTQTNVSIPILPADPQNTANNHYTYCGLNNNWELITVLESIQQSPKMQNDGVNDAYYEVGSSLSLFPSVTCTY